MSQEVCVSLQRKGPAIDVDFESSALGQIHVDNNALPEDERAGSAKKLLGEAALYCYTAALDKALDTRGARYESITGKARVTAGTNDKGQGRILGIALEIVVRMDEDYEDIFQRVSKVMRNGCLITASLDAAFPVTYDLRMEYTDD